MSGKTDASDPPFRFVYGTLSLDLAGTVADRGGTGVERLPSCERMGDWLLETGVVTDVESCTAHDLRRLRELRDHIYRAMHAAVSGRLPAREDIDALNETAAKPPVSAQLTARGVRLVRSGGAAAVRSTIARDALDVLGGERRDRLRICEMDGCGSIYIDESRGFRRRWCSMEACGNRAKAAAFRARS